MARVSYQERAIPVSDVLRPWISGISVATPTRDTRRTVLAEPDHATTLALREGKSVVMGPRTRARYHAPKRFEVCVRIRIQPGQARALLGRPVHDLVDRVVPLRDLLGADLPDLAAIEDLLTTRQRSARGEVVREAAGLLVGVGVRDTARRLNVSERHLRVLFTETVGVAPKHFARIDRVRTVLDRAGRGRLADLAAETGDYDQSHMTAEFRAVMGIPPGLFVAGELPPAGHCAGLVG